MIARFAAVLLFCVGLLALAQDQGRALPPLISTGRVLLGGSNLACGGGVCVPASNLVIATSVRRVVAGFSQAALTLTNAASASGTVGYTAAGDMDAKALTRFCGNTPCYMQGAAEQSGVAGTFQQLNAVNFQPTISPAGLPAITCGGYDNSASQIQYLRAQNNVSLTGDMTVAAVVNVAGSLNGTIITDRGNTTPFNGWSLQTGTANPGSKVASYQSTTKGATPSADTTSVWTTWPIRIIVSRISGALQFYINGIATSAPTGHGNPSAANAIPVLCAGFTNSTAGAGMKGSIKEVLVYSTGFNSTQVAALDANLAAYFPPVTNTPYQGTTSLVTSSLGNASGQGLQQAGGTNQFERTQPFTLAAATKMFGTPAVAAVLYTNVLNVGPFTGCCEFFVDTSCLLHARIIASFPTLYAGKISSINLCDGNWHTVTYSYDGSGLAVGMLLYVDGSPDSNATVEADTLGANTTIGANNIPSICTQAGEANFTCDKGPLGFLVMYNVAKSPAYISTNMANNGTAPPNDADAITYFTTFPTSGTNVTDGAATPHNGTLTNCTGATCGWPYLLNRDLGLPGHANDNSPVGLAIAG